MLKSTTMNGLVLVLLAACGPGDLRDASTPPGGEGEGEGEWRGGEGEGGADGADAVYAHSDSTLYRLDPQTLGVTQVAPFEWPDPQLPDVMTDLAINEDGLLVGISFTAVYTVDAESARCTKLADLDREFNGLSFVQDGSDERLLATAIDGSVYQLDPQTGMSTSIGSFGNDLGSSGDLVSVEGFGTVATAKSMDSWNDLLVRIDPQTGAATPIGDTGVVDIWGLGFWANRVYGFTGWNELVVIDPETGAATVQETGEVPWYGAGVTTAAPLI